MDAAPPKVLIIEDDETLREMYVLKLNMEGFLVEAARDGLEGLASVDLAMPDIIVLDMLMPNLNGLGFLERYRDIPRTPKAKVLVASNKSSDEQIEAARSLGASDYFVKSQLTPDDLVTHIRRYL